MNCLHLPTATGLGLLLVIVMTMPAYAQGGAQYKVGLYLKLPNGLTEREAEASKIYLEELQKDRLGRLKGVEVIPRKQDPTRGDASEEEWLRVNKINFYLVVWFMNPVGDAWPLKWELYDLQGRLANPRSAWPKPRGGFSKIRKNNVNDIEERAKEMRDEFGRMSGIKETKSVLISCFKRIPARSIEDDQQMLVLESALPSALHRHLQKSWLNKGYEAQVLEASNIASCCVKSENMAWLDNKKLSADYVIEGQILFEREGVSKITFTITTKRSMSSGAVPTKGLDPIGVPESLANYILNNWLTLEKQLE